MAWMAAVLPYAQAGVAVASTIGQGNAEAKLKQMEADQLNKQATADTATAVQQAKHERHRANVLKSRVVALSGKSGAGLSSPDIENTISDIDAQGEYNALAALHSGASSAGSKRFAATVAKSEGATARSGSRVAAGATILSEAQNYYG